MATTTAQRATPPVTTDSGSEIATTDPQQRPLYVRVKITHTPGSGLRIESSHASHLPQNIGDVLSNLSQPTRSYIERNGYQTYTLAQIWAPGGRVGTLAEWQEAYARHILNALMDEFVEPIELTAFNSPAYMAVAGVMYKLQPIESRVTNNAMSVLRRRVRAEVEAQRATLMARAERDASALITQANTRLQEATRTLDRARQVTNQSPPLWTIGTGNYHLKLTRYDTAYHWCVGCEVDFTFTHLAIRWDDLDPNRTTNNNPDGIIKREKTWRPLPANVKPIKTFLWLPFINAETGTYSIGAAHIDANYQQLPHVSYCRTCASVGGGFPTAITSPDTFAEFITAFKHLMRETDYSSPLVQWAEWSPDMRNYWSASVKEALAHPSDPKGALKRLTGAHTDTTTTPAAERSTVWTAAA